MMYLARELSWPKVKALSLGGAVALLPVGSTEAHGPHLPLSVDVIIAEEVCRRLSPRLSVDTVMFPPSVYSLTEFAAPFSGTVSIPADTARALLVSVLKGIGASFSKVAVINHHLEPAHFRLVHAAAKEAAAAVGAQIVVADHRREPTGPQLGDEFMHGGSHAGGYETSLMLAAAPALVDDVARRSLSALEVDLPARIKAGASNFLECGGPDAYFGDPSSASAAEGERLYALIVEQAVGAIHAMASFEPRRE
jgi:creatinine amidohydrolase